MDQQSSPPVPPLKPHQYPKWVLAIGVAVIAVLAYSMALLPNYMSATRELRSAQASYRSRDFDSAAREYLLALDRVPSSKVARLGAAKAIFSNSSKSDDLTGLKMLDGVALDSGEWSDLKLVMPVEYQKYFQETK